MAKLRQRYDDLKERYAVSDVTVSLQNVASQLGYSSIDSLSLEDTVVEIVSRIEKLMQAKTMMEAAGKPE
ncbi:shikimate kinase family protein [Hordeum vulgare]|nr:shikimate kinase family protein [Hordeum vulgare]